MKISASNAVPNAIEAAAAIYGVRCYRMQSRALPVIGAGGRPRPMFFGSWRDAEGTLYRKGMADLLLTPSIEVSPGVFVAVALWVECKAGTGELRKAQKLFKIDVTIAGAFYIEAHDSADAVVAWFEKYRVSR